MVCRAGYLLYNYDAITNYSAPKVILNNRVLLSIPIV